MESPMGNWREVFEPPKNEKEQAPGEEKPEVEKSPAAESNSKPLKSAKEIALDKIAEPTPEPLRTAAEIAMDKIKAEEDQEKLLEKSPEMAEIKKEIEAMPREEKIGLVRGLKSVGLYAMKAKSDLFAKGLEKVYGDQKPKNFFTRSIQGLAKTYRRDAETASKKLADARKGKTHGVFSSFYVGGNLVKYGRVIGDVVGWTTAMPLRYAMLGSLGFARVAEGIKEGQFANEALIDKTRIQDADAAAAEAWKIYEKAKMANGDQPVTKEALEEAYHKELPADLIARLNKTAPAEKVGIASRFVQTIAKWNIEYSAKKIQNKLAEIQLNKTLSKAQKAAEEKKLFARYERRLKDWDRAVTQYGTADALAMGARYAEMAGKTAVLAMGTETLINGAMHTIANLLSHSDLSHATETAAVHHTSGNAGGYPAPNEAAPHGAAEVTARGEAVPIPVPEVHANYTGIVGEHGSVWEAAKSIGLNQKEFAEAWTNPNSVIHTPEGPVHIHNLNLVHKGDIVKFFPGNGKTPGHFEVLAGSGKTMGQGLPVEHISKAQATPTTFEKPSGPIGPVAEHPTAEEQAVHEYFGQPATGHENIMGYPDHPPVIPTHPNHPAGNPIWENQPAPEHTVINETTPAQPLTHEHIITPHHPEVPHPESAPLHHEAIPIHADGIDGKVSFEYNASGDPISIRQSFNLFGSSGHDYLATENFNKLMDYANAHKLDVNYLREVLETNDRLLLGYIKTYNQLKGNPQYAKEAAFVLKAIQKTVQEIISQYGPDFVKQSNLADFLK